MSYILGTKLVFNKQVRLALTQIFGIGPKKATWICDQLGLSDNTKVSNLTRHQIDQISTIVRRNKFLVDSELKRKIQQYIKRLINISCYRGFRHKAGLPLRGQRTHSNGKTCRKSRKVSINQWKKKSNQRKKKSNSGQNTEKKNETEKMEMRNTIMQKQPSRHQQRQLRRQQKHHQKPKKHHQTPRKHYGIAHIQSTFKNTFITITNCKGDERTGSSSGCLREFRGSRRSDKYVGQAIAECVAQAAIQLEIRLVEVKIKGIGRVRKRFLLKGLKEGGLIITRIRDVTPMPHNGCRPPKKRRV